MSTRKGPACEEFLGVHGGSSDDDVVVFPTIGDFKNRLVRRAASKALASQKQEDLAKEAKDARLQRQIRETVPLLSTRRAGTEERSVAQLQQQVQEDLDMITKVATKSSNLKGSFVRALKDGAASIESLMDADEVLGACTISVETRQLQVRVIRGYRTISHEAAYVLEAPWDLDVEVLSGVYWSIPEFGGALSARAGACVAADGGG